MLNEFIFSFHALFIGLCTLIAFQFGSFGLSSFICIQSLLANIFILKETTLFGFTAVCTDVFTIGCTLSLNLLQEYYGPAITKKIINLNFFLFLFYVCSSQIHLWYLPASTDIMHPLFELLLGTAPRIIFASLLVSWISQMFDFWLYKNMKRIFQTKLLILRNYFSIILSQLLDTVLFSFIGLYGLIDNISNIIIISFLIKLISIMIIVPFVKFTKNFFLQKGIR
jgi:queuosine precursor transporter